MTNSPKTFHFAVAPDRPLYATLEEYGVDDSEMNYIWLLHGRMGENLCEGLDAARLEAERLGWVMYSFSSPAEVIAAARIKTDINPPWEASNLYWVALALTEHLEGSNSQIYMDICQEFAPVARSMGNDDLANDLQNNLRG
jgi:hypothetical protein